jgi:hypothetical protein
LDLAWLLLLFPPAPVVTPTVTCNKRKTEAVVFIIFFSFSDLILSSLFFFIFLPLSGG